MVRLSSLLDNDFYKFTMQQCVAKLFPKARARYRFTNRGDHSFPPGFELALQQSVNEMASLKLTIEEKSWLAETCPYLDPVYLDFLQGYTYDPGEIKIVRENDQIYVSIEGLWYRTILWEVPLLALISENYYKLTGKQRISDEEVIQKTIHKMEAFTK